MLSKRHIWLCWALFALLFLPASCVMETGSEEFVAPEIVSAEASVNDLSVRLECVLSSSRAQMCGFVYWSGGQEKQTVTCGLSAASFSATISGLAPGTTYVWYAFARVGENEVHSAEGSFTTPQPDPEVQGIYIPDPYFRRYLLENFDADGDGALSEEEGLTIRTIRVATDKISSLKGIEYFKNLDSLLCRGMFNNEYENNGYPGMLDSLDVSSNRKLRYLACDKNMLRSLKVSDNPFLEEILCSYNLLEEIDLKAVPRLQQLRMWVNNVSELDFSNTQNLCTLECGGNPITSVDVSPCTKLETLNVGDLRLSEVDIRNNKNLKWLGTYGTDISKLDLSGNPKLEALNCMGSPVTRLDLSPCTKLYELKCWDCPIEDLDVSMLPNLKILECSPASGLKTLCVSESQEIEGVTVRRSSSNVPDATEIVVLKAGTIFIPDTGFKNYLLQRFDLDSDGEISLGEAQNITDISMDSEDWGVTSLQGIEYMPNLTYLYCAGKWYDDGKTNGPLGTLRRVDVSHNPKLVVLNLSHNKHLGETIKSLDISNNPLLEEIYFWFNNLEYPDVSCLENLKRFEGRGCYGKVPDFSKFTTLECLEVQNSKDDSHFSVDVSRCPNLETLRINCTDGTISDLTLNTKLKELEIDDCPNQSEMITSLVPKLPLLELISVGGNKITSLDLSNAPRLKHLNVGGNGGLKVLDLSSNPELEYLCCDLTGLSELDLTANTKIEELRCWCIGLSELDLSANRDLKRLYCDDNRLTELDFGGCPKLEYINCSGNQLTSLDLSGLPSLACLDCKNNLISTLDVSANLMLGTGSWDGGRVGLYCSPMNGADGGNILQTLYVSASQSLPGITTERSADHVPAGTKIIVK